MKNLKLFDSGLSISPMIAVKTGWKLIIKLSEHYPFKQQWEVIERFLFPLSYA